MLISSPSVTETDSNANATSPAARAISHATGTPAATHGHQPAGGGEVRVVAWVAAVPAPGDHHEPASYRSCS